MPEVEISFFFWILCGCERGSHFHCAPAPFSFRPPFTESSHLGSRTSDSRRRVEEDDDHESKEGVATVSFIICTTYLSGSTIA